jgi:hypothetical protein
MRADALTGEGVGYFRGGGSRIEPRHLRRATVTLVFLSLAVLFLALAVDGWREYRRESRLHAHAVPVLVSVTGCRGLASGTGITVPEYRCTGSFVVDGRPHQAVIRGLHTVHRADDSVPAYVDPGDPATLAVSVHRPSPQAFLPAAVVGLLVGAGALAATWRRRRLRLDRAPRVGVAVLDLDDGAPRRRVLVAERGRPQRTAPGRLDGHHAGQRQVRLRMTVPDD